ncbi:hypothetical protein QL285_038832 [Trifolium repens]|nr:hypothetical protein QL285_038832 [Trifolium repens]
MLNNVSATLVGSWTQIFGDSKPFQKDEVKNVQERCGNIILKHIEASVDTVDILKDQEVVGSDQPSMEVPKEKDDKPSPSNEDKDNGGSSSSKNHHKQKGAGLAKE